MHRLTTSLFAAAILLVFSFAVSDCAVAQDDEAAPETQTENADGETSPTTTPASDEGEGPLISISLIKLGGCLVVYLLWILTTDWINQDCQRARQNYSIWNNVAFFSMIVAGGLGVLVIPSFIITILLLVVAWLGPLIAYIVVRNKAVASHERVLTREHIRYLAANSGQLFGVKIDATKKAAYELGAAVDLSAMGAANEQADQANLILARQSPGYVPVKDLVASLIDRRVEAILMDFNAEGVEVRAQIDGVWHADAPLERSQGDLMLAVMKQLCGLNPEERRKPQSGKFGAKFQKQKLHCELTSQGTKTGERASLKVIFDTRVFGSLVDLGMREKQVEPLLEFMGGDQGFVLYSSPLAGGLTTMIEISLVETDRLLRNFVAIEDSGDPQRDIENLEVTTFNKAAGETPMTVLPKLLRTYPDVIVVRDLEDKATVETLSNQVAEKRLIVGGIRAKSAPEALLRVLALKAPRETFAQAVSCVINGRLVRKLCDECRVGFEPTPDMLKKLGLPANKVQTMYREPKPEERDKVCEKCQGIGYYGRTSLFQMLVVDDSVRQILIQTPQMEAVNKAARKAKMRTLQEEGILLVAKGVTSLQEVMRALKA